MSKRFRYHADPQQVKQYVEALGYQVTEFHSQDETDVLGFRVHETTVELSYDPIAKDPTTGDLKRVGYGLITLWDDAYSIGADTGKLERSRSLYEQLYRRFRRR